MISKSPKYIFYFVYFALLIIIAVHFILNLGLSMTDSNGCYRSYNAGNFTQTVKSFFDPLQDKCQTLS